MRTTTTRRTSVRRAAAATGLVVLGGLLPALAIAAPAQAAQECTDETPEVFLGVETGRCDDVTPPQTTLQPVAPAPNAAGWLRTPDVTLTFGSDIVSTRDETDQGVVTFQCRLTGPSQAHGWQACTSPRTYTGLADSPAGSYAFSVRALDSDDHDTTPLSTDPDGTLYPAGGPLAPLGQPAYPAEAVADFDATPATTSWRIDTRAPVGLLFGAPVDAFTPDEPVLPSQALALTLRANETGATFTCLLDDRSVPCAAGRNTLGPLRPGAHTFRAALVDPAGNVGSGDLETAFWSAHDLLGTRAQRARWKVRRDPAAVGGSYLETTTRGALLTVPARRLGELRLIARTGPGAGKVRVRVGRARWTTYDLSSTAAEAQDLAQFQVRGPFRARTTGTVQVQVTSSGKPVRVDGLVLR